MNKPVVVARSVGRSRAVGARKDGHGRAKIEKSHLTIEFYIFFNIINQPVDVSMVVPAAVVVVAPVPSSSSSAASSTSPLVNLRLDHPDSVLAVDTSSNV